MAAGQYTGATACGKCHPQQYSQQSKSGHARSLSLRSDHLLAGRFPPNAGEWAFGAGDQAVTFVSRLDSEHYIEHGLSYYAKSQSMALTPGHTAPTGVKYRTFDPDAAISRCFQCHSTGPLRLQPGSRIAPSELGVRCESCHGPGETHGASQSAIVNPKRMSAKQVNDLCGACHRKATAEEYTNWEDAWNVRHQPVYFAQSRCFIKSTEKLTCFTCHAPHAPVSRLADDYSGQCKACHESVRHKAPTASKPCTSCHMPAVKLNANLQFANHWIGIYEPGRVLRPVR